MANLIDIKVPDIGDFRDVPIIEVLVKPGDRVKTEDPLITLESDKASMEVPSPVDGVVKEVRVKVGDKVSEGSLILVAEAEVAPAGLAPREKIKEGGRSTGEGAPVADYGAASGVYEVIEVRVPDIGDFKDVPIIEIAVKSGDKVKPEDPLITLESDKASMEVPSPSAGTVKDVRVKIGDKVGEGSRILTLETGLTHAAPAAPAATRAAPGAPMPMAARHVGEADHECDMLVLGAGPGGYSAAFRSADLGMTTVLVERYPTLGGVCLNVGCIPSKALLHTASVIDEVKQMAAHGISYSAPQIDLAKLRTHKEKVVGKLTGGLAGMAKARRVTVLEGVGKFLDPHHLEVAAKNGGGRKGVKFDKSIIAAGSEAIKLPFIPDDPRVIDSTGALELRQMPKSMLVIGGGIIGLEMATVYSSLGTRIDVVEMLDGLMTGADPDLVQVWEKKNAGRFDKVMLKTRTVAAEATPNGIKVRFEGEKAPAEPQVYDMVLVAVGRSPNGRNIAAENAGVAVSERGFIPVDKQMRTNLPHIFAIGDIVGQPMLAHKATHEGKVAAETAAGKNSFFDAKVIPSVAYTDPEVAWAGLTENEAKAKGIKYGKGLFPWAASGRSLSLGRDEGVTKLLFDEATNRLLGCGIVGPNAGDLIAEAALAIEMGADAEDIGLTVHPHPTLSETVAFAAEMFEGTITDLIAPKKK